MKFGLLLVFAILPFTANAAKDPCASIKPEQQLETVKQQELDSMVKAGIVGLGSGQAAVTSSSHTEFDTQLLAEDDLARGWYVYQLCVMKRDEVLSASLHEALMRELFGLGQAPAATSTVTSTVATTNCNFGLPVDDVNATSTLVVVNGMSFPIKTQEERTFFQNMLSDCRKGDAAILFEKWMRTVPIKKKVGPLTLNSGGGALPNPGVKGRFVEALQD